MPPGNNVLAQAQSRSRSLAGGLGGKEGLKDFSDNILWDTVAVIANREIKILHY
ncbi:hypothetical protein FPE01S_02_02800 [Flavihumibacter petaseus NBRC 106054]|uniref:Uncharacterized protein n=1 Tax=Flavihumibacter petaseus NBRC 106054 TaxID=1220578 RepID=A0A0E9N0K7_9BACT|nr:hypothetical protein FPE01S_02_02800 [Flavihumibacter petaseus NBRC 106054]